MFGAIVFLPLFLQAVTGASATNSGLLLLPLMAGLMTTSVGSGRVIARPGHYRRWPLPRLIPSAAGITLMSTLHAAPSRRQSSRYMLVLGISLGMIMPVPL